DHLVGVVELQRSAVAVGNLPYDGTRGCGELRHGEVVVTDPTGMGNASAGDHVTDAVDGDDDGLSVSGRRHVVDLTPPEFASRGSRQLDHGKVVVEVAGDQDVPELIDGKC